MGAKDGGKSVWSVELCAALLVTAAAVVLHIRFFLNAGALWRDEITSVNFAAGEPFSRVISHLYYDAFPILWPIVVRLWVKSGMGGSDAHLRVLGLISGLLVLAALWRNARRFGGTAPVLSVALLGFTSSVLCYGDSFRAYGLGMFLGLVTMGLIWELTRKASFGSFAAASVAGLASVHILFFNCVLLLGSCCGAIAVMASKKQWARAGLVLALGMICAASMLIYLPMARNAREPKMFQSSVSLSTLRNAAQDALDFLPEGNIDPGFNAFWWILIVTGAICLVPMRLWLGNLKGLSPPQRDVVVFCAVNLFVGLVAYALFLKILSYSPEPWYFLAGMAMVAGTVDGLIAGVQSAKVRIILVIVGVAFAVNAAVPVWSNIGDRKTNVDLIARQLQTRAAAGDLVVVAPWQIGVTFVRYYHGPAEVVTVPPVPFLVYQRYDQLLPFLQDRHAMGPLRRRLVEILHQGHRVWLVETREYLAFPANWHFFQESEDAANGWQEPFYEISWRDEVFNTIRRNAKDIQVVKVPSDQPTSHYENAELLVAEGK